jgi:CheY-like chemotaxis protein
MDIQMPKMDGFEAIRQLRARPDMTDVPIIALTAMAMRGDQERCLEAGANLYFAKPVRLPTLLESINSLIADRGAMGRGSATPQAG